MNDKQRVVDPFATTVWKAGELVVSVGEWTTTIGAELERPPKFRWISARACTDCDPFACQPAPESAASTFGANTASASAITAQVIETARTWLAARDNPPAQNRGAGSLTSSSTEAGADCRPAVRLIRRGDQLPWRRCSRFSAIALRATSTLDPDIEIAAASGRKVTPKGSKTPAAIGSASEL